MYKTAGKLTHLGKPVNLAGPVPHRKRRANYSNFTSNGDVSIEVDISRSQLRKRNRKLQQKQLKPKPF
jgi:hypothetical protein